MKMKELTIQEVLERVNNNYYKSEVKRPVRPEGYKVENYVYNEEESVRWNREHRLELEENYIKELEKYQEAERAQSMNFQYDLEKAINNEYNINAAQFKLLFNKASSITDSVEELIWEMQDLAELYLSLKQEELN